VFLVFDKFAKKQRFDVVLFIYLFRELHPKWCFFSPKNIYHDNICWLFEEEEEEALFMWGAGCGVPTKKYWPLVRPRRSLRI